VFPDIFNQRGHHGKPNHHGVQPCVADGEGWRCIKFYCDRRTILPAASIGTVVQRYYTAGMGYLESSLDCALKKSSVGIGSEPVYALSCCRI
jgi:hypothetical protein